MRRALFAIAAVVNVAVAALDADRLVATHNLQYLALGLALLAAAGVFAREARRPR